MSEESQGGFFSQIKNQIITTVGVIITAAGGLVVTNMEAIFGVNSSPEQVEVVDTKSDAKEESKTDTIVIVQKNQKPVVAKPAPVETKKEFEW